MKTKRVDFSKEFMITLFVSHTKRNIFNESTVGNSGSWHIRESLRNKNDYIYHSRLSCQLNGLEGKSFYAERDINTDNNRVPVVAINSIVMRTILDKSLYSIQLKMNKQLIDYLAKVARNEISPSITEYRMSLLQMSEGILKIHIVAESVDTYATDMLKEGMLRNIELPMINDRKFTLNEALILTLSRDKETVPKKLQEYANLLKTVGFEDYNTMLDCIFSQQLATLMEDDCLPCYVLTLGEYAYLNKLNVQDVHESFIRCRDKNNLLSGLKNNELLPIAEYFVKTCYDSINEQKGM